jgi:hypothetical protein
MTATETKSEKKRTLFNIENDMLAFFDLLDEAENDEDADRILETWFDENLAELQNKADGYAAVVREFEYRAEAREAEAQRLADSARAMKNRSRSLKYRFMSTMQFLGMDRLDTDINMFRICANGGKLPLDIHDPTKIPDEFIRQIPEIDRDGVRLALEAGKQVPGAVLQERGRHLRIR